MQLAGRTTLITGAVGGLGTACARLFAAEGSNVVLFDISPAVQDMAAEIGSAISVTGDVTCPEHLAEGVALAKERFGGVDTLVCCSGTMRTGTVGEISVDEWKQVIDVNLTGVFLACRAVLPGMVEQKSGSIVTVSSHFGLVGVTNMAAYCAAKGGVIQLTRAIALDYGASGIRANCLCPGMFQTNMLTEVMAKVGRAREWVDMMRGLPRGIQKSESMARAALFLASDASSSMNGAVLTADGGYTAR